MRAWNVRILRTISTVTGFGLVVLLAWGATVGINSIYGLGGRREVTQRLNPLFVQTYASMPPEAQPYLSFKSRNIFGEVVLVIHTGRHTVNTTHLKAKPHDLKHEFLTALGGEGAYELFLKRISGRGFIKVIQNPNGENGYTAKIKIDDPYFHKSVYQFQVWYRKVQ